MPIFTPKRAFFLYFSPTGGVRRVSRRMLSAARSIMPNLKLEEMDLTLPERRFGAKRFGEGDVVFFAVPSYGGRIPSCLMGFKGIKSEGAAGVPVAVYGNRAYEDALRELGALMSDRGFKVAAGAAFIARHNQHPKLGAGRPNDQDEAVMRVFIKKLAEKLAAAENEDALAVKLPGEGPLKAEFVVPAPPRIVDPESCCRCGSCAEKCPVGIIDPQSFAVTDPESCLGCRACMTACPGSARDFPEPVRSAIDARMEQICQANAGQKAPEYFL